MSIQVNNKNLGHATAYAYAVAGGYTGTEAEFTELLGNIADDLGQIENLTVTVETLAAGSSATASYSDGVLHLGIPKGDKGDKGDTGATGPTGPTGNGIASVAKTGTSGLVDTYTITYTNGNTSTFTVTNGAEAVDDTLTIAGRAADAKKTGDEISALKSELNDKADKVGYSENLISGLSEQLDSKNVMVNQVPYVFRKTPTGAGTRKRETVVGGTVNWNQLVQNGNFADKSIWTAGGLTFTVSGNVATLTKYGTSGTNFYQSIEKYIGHKYFYAFDIYGSVSCDFAFVWGNIIKSISMATTKTRYSGIFSAESAANNNLNFYTAENSGMSEGDTLTLSNINLIDLTAMFGTTIADYIYSLETANAGDGVALFRSLFPNDYYSYSAAGLESVKVSGHKTVGKNLMSTPIVGEYVTDAGVVQEMNSAHWRTDKILVPYGVSSITMTKFTNPNGYEGSFGVIWFDSQGNVISYEPFFSGTHSIPFYQTKSVPANASYCYLRGYYGSGAAAVLSCKAQAEWGSVSTEYEPHEEHTYPLDPVDLRGIPKLDANNNLYYDGDEYEADGTVTRRFGIMDLGTLDWNYSSGTERFQATLPNRYGGVDRVQILCSSYIANTNVYLDSNNTVGICCYNNSVFVRDFDYTDAATFKTAMSGVYLVYELATPITESAAPFVPVMAVDPDGTEEYIDAGVTASTPTRDVAIPAGHYSEYPENQVAKLDGLPKDFSTLIAPTEQTYTATRNYTSGALLIVNNILYKATANIANGGTITPNTNVTATTLAEVIAAL